jgi:hypothetical protein
MRVLLDNDPGDSTGGGGATPPPPPQPDPALAATQTELAAARKRIADLEAAEASRLEAARKEEEKKLAEKGQFDSILKARDAEVAAAKAQAAAAEHGARTYARDRELALVLGKHPILEGKSGQLVQLWRDDFEAVLDGAGGFRVQAKDLRPIETVIAERLATPEFDHFMKPSNTGGGGPSRGAAGGPTPKPGEPKKPPTLLEAAKERLSGQRINGFGLRPVRRG